MRDWEKLVREHLRGLSLESRERHEVIVELAAHLEEMFEELRRQGPTEERAAERALSQVRDWQALRRKIQRARRKEDGMTDRVKQVWLPGFLTLFLSMMLLMAIQFFGPKPWVVSPHGWRVMAPMAVIYVPWLLCLVPIGAMGTYLSVRAGASRRGTFVSIVFPVLPYFVFFVVAFPVCVILDDHVAHNVVLSALWVGLVTWVVLPAVALLAGGLPVQLLRSRRPASADSARA
ncbi:MAG TPA: hypothetical protein VMI32_02640 [Candidatus Solibacter sp.]|nr:hypothetical protein [Candidatus Solibacter sp.]